MVLCLLYIKKSQNRAVDSQDYLALVKSALVIADRYAIIAAEDSVHTLKELVISYMVQLGHEKQALSDDNRIVLKKNLLSSNGYLGSTRIP